MNVAGKDRHYEMASDFFLFERNVYALFVKYGLSFDKFIGSLCAL